MSLMCDGHGPNVVCTCLFNIEKKTYNTSGSVPRASHKYLVKAQLLFLQVRECNCKIFMSCGGCDSHLKLKKNSALMEMIVIP